MDFSKSGNPKMGKDKSRQTDPNLKSGKVMTPKGSTKVPNLRPTKEELLSRIKAAADKAKATPGHDSQAGQTASTATVNSSVTTTPSDVQS